MLIDPGNRAKGCWTQACNPLITELSEWLVRLALAVAAPSCSELVHSDWMVPPSGTTQGLVQYPIILVSEVHYKTSTQACSLTLIGIGEADIHCSHEAPLWGHQGLHLSWQRGMWGHCVALYDSVALKLKTSSFLSRNWAPFHNRALFQMGVRGRK
jgi:hypothetical protein